MSLINLIRIDDVSGILVADEEFWRRGSRRTLSLDTLQPVLPEEYAESAGMEVVIGIEGDPSLTYEATLKVQQRIKEVIADPSKAGRDEPPRTLKDVVDLAIREIARLIRRRIDDQLKFAYGFSSDDLNRGYFEESGEKIDIKQDVVRTDALKWTSYSEKNRLNRRLIEVDAVIAGIDKDNGFHWYEWAGDPGNVFLGTGLFESIGRGCDAANLAFIDTFRKKELEIRRKGMAPEEALFALIETMEAAGRFNHEVGGYPHFVIIDGHKTGHKQRYREFSGHGAKLAQEIVTAWVHGFIKRQDAIKLINQLVFKGADFEAMETLFMEKSKDSVAMEHFLRGYKTNVATVVEEISS